MKYKQRQSLAQRKIAGELFVVDPAHRCLHLPNEPAEFLWDLLKKGITAHALVSALRDEYDVPQEKAEKDVRHFLRELKRKKLIEESKA